MQSICIESHQVSGIPYLIIAPTAARGLPVVFYNHGFGGSKEEGLQMGYRLAEAGLACVAIDADRHGQRLAAPLDDLDHPERSYIYPKGCGFDTYFVMLECARQTARDIETLLDYFALASRLDTARVGVTGFSMGGFASYFSAAGSPRISAAVPMGAYPDLPRRWQDLIVEALVYEEWTEAIEGLTEENERRARWLAEIDPAAKMLRAYRKPLLILHGELDTDSPKAYTMPFFAALRQQYQAQPEQLRMKIYDFLPHRLDGQMISDAVDWFRRWLGGTS